MKSIKEAGNPQNNETQQELITDTDYLTAQQLRDVTLSKEQLFSIAKKNICDSIMESMVGVATKNGRNFYATNLLAAMDEKLVDEIVEKFKALDYTVDLTNVLKDTKSGQQYKTLTVSWTKEDVSN